MSRPNILVINRFYDADADYTQYLGDDDALLTIITTDQGIPWVGDDPRVRAHVVQSADEASFLGAASALQAEGNHFDGVVALSEYDMVAAARVREMLGTRGHSVSLTLGFRDKVIMKERLFAAGIRVPRFMRVDATDSSGAVVAAVGLPVVLKPTSSAGSVGVSVHHSEESLAKALESLGSEEFECEEYVSDEVLHVDGVVRNGIHLFTQVSAYVGNPLRFLDGEPLGSFTLNSPEATAAAHGAVDALNLADGVYHLELLRHPSGELVFLEVGMRAGGAEVVDVLRECRGIDLFEETFRAAVELPSRLGVVDDSGSSAVHTGWLVYPGPSDEPVTGVTAMLLGDVVPSIYREHVCSSDDVLAPDGGYMRGPARYCLRAESSEQVRHDIQSIIATEPVSRGFATATAKS